MPVIQSEIDANSPEFVQNKEAMLAAIASFRDVEQLVLNKANPRQAQFGSIALFETDIGQALSAGVGPGCVMGESGPGRRALPAPRRPQLLFARRAATAASRAEVAEAPGRQRSVRELRQVERHPPPAARAVALKLIAVPRQVSERRKSNGVNPCHARRMRAQVAQGVTQAMGASDG